MVNMRRKSVLVFSSLFFCAPQLVNSFGVNSPLVSHQPLRPAPAVLFATPKQKDDDTGGNRRRGFIGTVVQAFSGIATALIFSTKNSRPAIAIADDTLPTSGRIVKVEVANLDGVDKKRGHFLIQLRPEWAPRGARRFEELTEHQFFNDCRIFRVLPGFVAQFGINGNPDVQSQWRSSSLPDDPIKVSNTRGTVVFATAGPNSRTTQIFVNTRETGNVFLDQQGFSPFGKVIEGMDVVERFYSGYGDGPPGGKGPNQAQIQAKGNNYLTQQYPKLSYISKVSFV